MYLNDKIYLCLILKNLLRGPLLKDVRDSLVVDMQVASPNKENAYTRHAHIHLHTPV